MPISTFIRKNRLILIITIALLGILIVMGRIKSKIKENKSQISYKVIKGSFEISVTTTGELESEHSTQIMTPTEILQSIDIWEINLMRILPEGSIIDSGIIVAELDPAKIFEKLSEIETSLQNEQIVLENAKADTAFELGNLRDEMDNFKFNIQELELTLKQSIYEPPSIIKQAEMTLEKAKREYEQKLKNYELKKSKSSMLINQSRMQLSYFEKRKEKVMEAFDKIIIKSPGKGMLVYQKDFEGKPIKSGSVIRMQADQSIAIIPDFSSMISTTFVNEIDISKLKIGQNVLIGIDAFPNNKYTGEVIQIANMGEELKGSSAKVFKVLIRLNSTDTFLRPGMTTSNKISINSYPDKYFIPLESIHSSGDKNFVFLRKGLKTIKKQVIAGEINDNFIIIEKGLVEGEEVLLSIPEKAQEMKISEFPI